MLDGNQRVNVGSTDIWRLAQITIKIISPGVDKGRSLARAASAISQQESCPVAAHILKHIYFTVPIPCHDHRNAQKYDWLEHNRLADFLAKITAAQLSRNRVPFHVGTLPR